MNAHLLVTHFPVSLVVVATVLDLLGIGMGDQALRNWAWRFLLAAAVGVFLAFATGEGASLAALASGSVDVVRFSTHQEWGSVGVWVVIGAALLRTLWRHRQAGAYSILNLLVLLVATALLIAITLSGTLVRHGA